MKRVRNLFALVLVCGMLLGLCVAAEAATPKISAEKMTVMAGKTAQLSVEDAGSKKVTWKSSNEKVAEISDEGEITAKKAGKAKITAKVSGKKLTCNLTVVKKNTPMLSATEITLETGKSTKLSVMNAGKKTVKWSSNKKSVVTVSSKGKVKAKKAGSAKITAKVGSKKLTCKVTVEDEPEEAVAQAAYARTVTNGTIRVSAGSRFLGIFSPQVRVTNTGSRPIDVYNQYRNLVINLKSGRSFVTNCAPNSTTYLWCCGTWYMGGNGTMTVSAVRRINSIW